MLILVRTRVEVFSTRLNAHTKKKIKEPKIKRMKVNDVKSTKLSHVKQQNHQIYS